MPGSATLPRHRPARRARALPARRAGTRRHGGRRQHGAGGGGGGRGGGSCGGSAPREWAAWPPGRAWRHHHPTPAPRAPLYPPHRPAGGGPVTAEACPLGRPFQSGATTYWRPGCHREVHPPTYQTGPHGVELGHRQRYRLRSSPRLRGMITGDDTTARADDAAVTLSRRVERRHGDGAGTSVFRSAASRRHTQNTQQRTSRQYMEKTKRSCFLTHPGDCTK